jgi:hydrogenase expression/formation protein HypC
MCLGIPAKIIKIEAEKAIVSLGGSEIEADLSMIETPKVGEYILVHAGFAIEKVDEEEALETLKLLKELGES